MSVRVSVTLSDELNIYFTALAKEQGVSKDKLLSSILSAQHISTHNSRGAGRKSIFGDSDILAMKDYRSNGMSYREIANRYNCSVGLIHKLINE